MALQIISISHRFKAQEVLRNVSLTIEAGDCYGLLGHNGAGKTTLLRSALGLLRPTSGVVAVDGFNIQAYPREARARLGGLIESPGFNETWNGVKNLAIWARLQGFSRPESLAEARRVLAMVGLDRVEGILGHKKVRDYSQGMKQRLGIAQALMGQPSYLLLDEPMNGLDPQAMVEVRLLIQRLIADHHVTVVISSHQLGEISGLCNKVAILRRGVLLVEDSMDHLLEPDKSLYRLSVAAETVTVQAALGDWDLTPQRQRDPVHPHQSTFLIDLSHHTPAELTRCLLEKGIDLLALAPCESSLEEVYLNIDARTGHADSASSAPPPGTSSQSLGRPQERRAPTWAWARGVQYELTRLLSGFKIAGLLLLPALLAGLSIAVLHRDAAAQAQQVGQEVFSTTQMTAFDGMGRGLKTGLPILMVLLAGLASQSIAGEQSKGTLRYLLLRPINRWGLLWSKFSALIVICLGAYILLLLASLGASVYYFDFKDLAEILPNGKLFPLVQQPEMFQALRSTLWAPILPLMAYIALGFALGSCIKNNVVALTTTLGVLLLLDLGRAFMPGQEAIGWLLSAHLPSPLGGHSFLRYYTEVVQGVSNATHPYAHLAVIVPSLWWAAAMVPAMIAIKRKAG